MNHKRGLTDDSNVDTDVNRGSKRSRTDGAKSFGVPSKVDFFHKNDWGIQVHSLEHLLTNLFYKI